MRSVKYLMISLTEFHLKEMDYAITGSEKPMQII